MIHRDTMESKSPVQLETQPPGLRVSGRNIER